MSIYAVIDNNIVVGRIVGDAPPTVNIPVYRTFIDITNGPALVGGDVYDPVSNMFWFANQAPVVVIVPPIIIDTGPTIEERVTALENRVTALGG